MKITRDEWMDELLALTCPKDDPGLTAGELAAKAGCQRDAMRKRLNRLAAEGKVVVGRARRRDVRGNNQPVPVYRPKGDKR